MPSKVIACETIKDELEMALRISKVNCEIVWIESGLHNFPDRLRESIQKTLNSVSGKRVLLAFGCCGNAIVGLKTGDFELVIPRVDDCISLLVGSMEKRMELCREEGIYFLTPGWLRGERNLWVEYEYTVKKYGQETAKEVFNTMMAHYRYLGLLDTGAYDLEQMLLSTRPIAETLMLEEKIIPATVDYLSNLLVGPWPEEDFVIVPPETLITDFPLKAESSTMLQ